MSQAQRCWEQEWKSPAAPRTPMNEVESAQMFYDNSYWSSDKLAIPETP
jgi:hypothetical protein